MISDGSSLPVDHPLEVDVCIVGSGPAGISLALELDDGRRKIALLEAGGLEQERADLDFMTGDNVGLRYDLARSRLRCFGGSTAIWSGYCSPMDPLDFEEVDWIPHSGWPIRASDLEPFYGRALGLLGLPETYGFELEDWADDQHYQLADPPRDLLERKIWLFEKTRFGERYRAPIRDSSGVHAFLRAPVTEVRFSGDERQHVTGVTVQSAADRRHEVRAALYVLAAGGFENARLMLVSKPQGLNRGIGHPLVGRFFADHPHFYGVANLLLLGGAARSRLYRRGKPRGDAAMTAFWQLPAAYRRSHRLNNIAFRADPGPRPGTLGTALETAFKGLHGGRRNATRMVKLTLMGAARPNPDSRLTLSKRLDPFGVPRLQLDWRLLPEDWATHDESYRRFEQLMVESGSGRLGSEPWMTAEELTEHCSSGDHMLSTTRMAASAEQGVVDPDCKVFDVDNLYVAGSSVFTTAGCSNPTFTILALTLRLADHVRSVLSDLGR